VKGRRGKGEDESENVGTDAKFGSRGRRRRGRKENGRKKKKNMQFFRNSIIIGSEANCLSCTCIGFKVSDVTG
jgi:hypothetical protein